MSAYYYLPDAEICAQNSISLLELLRSKNIPVKSSCGGTFLCGKCKVLILGGALPPTDTDRRFISNEDLDKGVRLACCYYPQNAIHILLEDEQDFSILSDDSTEKTGTYAPPYSIAVDIGTTTIVMQLIDCDANVMAEQRSLNPQRSFGYDVISRINAANNGKLSILSELIKAHLLNGIDLLVQESKILANELSSIAMAGNTTMLHLLLGYPCGGLGSYPFTPYDLSLKTFTFSEMFSCTRYNCKVSIMPGISAFIGSDVVMGLLANDFDRVDTPRVLIDLGTNGEIAFGCKDRILTASAAAGPAFEGGNISCGTGSISGAVSDVLIEGEDSFIKLIGSGKWTAASNATGAADDIDHGSGVPSGITPRGICGSGVIALVSELVRAGIVDSTGLMSPEYFDNGFKLTKDITFAQKDIREVQLAKSAIRACLETLRLRYNSSESVPIYLAGGFGHGINIDKAVNIGLLPEWNRAMMHRAGNSCLQGLKLVLRDSTAEKRVSRLIEISSEIVLSLDDSFNKMFMEYMSF